MRQTGTNQARFRKLILLLLLAGIVVIPISPAGAVLSGDSGQKPVVTIAVRGDPSNYLGEEVVFSGTNSASDTTYLFITGPNLPKNGGKLASPLKTVQSDDASTFTIVKTRPDSTWEYTFQTANLKMDAGTYTVYAVSSPLALDRFGDSTPQGSTGIIVKKPFIMGEIAPATVVQGQAFTVTGTAEGIPPEVRIWIIGNTTIRTAKATVSSEAAFTFTADAAMSKKLQEGQNYLIVQHPMADNRFDIDLSGDYVKNLNLNNGTNLFRVTGPGSLQGRDAKDALVAAFRSNVVPGDTSSTADTYTVIPFTVAGAGARAPATTTTRSSGASTGTGVTISVDGDQSYYFGERVILRGISPGADTVYLSLTGPNLPSGGAKLSVAKTAVISGNPDSFTVVKTKPDGTWEYPFYTANVMMDAGMYEVYAMTRPEAKDPSGPKPANVEIILKRPFIFGDISPVPVTRGQPFTITGTAEGNPELVRIWILGDAPAFTSDVPVKEDASFVFTGDDAISGNLAAGQNYLFVQHPMQNNRFDIGMDGVYVRTMNNSTNLFKISGPGSLQGSSAADALITAFSDSGAADDTYTVISFQVTDSTGPRTSSSDSVPSGQQSPGIPVQYAAPIGAGALILCGIILWRRH